MWTVGKGLDLLWVEEELMRVIIMDLEEEETEEEEGCR